MFNIQLDFLYNSTPNGIKTVLRKLTLFYSVTRQRNELRNSDMWQKSHSQLAETCHLTSPWQPIELTQCAPLLPQKLSTEIKNVLCNSQLLHSLFSDNGITTSKGIKKVTFMIKSHHAPSCAKPSSKKCHCFIQQSDPRQYNQSALTSRNKVLYFPNTKRISPPATKEL